MKLIGIMSLREDRDAVREILREQDVAIYSEVDIVGHTTETIARVGWFATGGPLPEYSTLCFAIVPDASADQVFTAIAGPGVGISPDHPVRAFLVPVERMV